MTDTRRTWRGKWVSPQTPGEAWRRFAVDLAVILAVAGGVLAVTLMALPGGVNLNPGAERTYLFVLIGAAIVLPVMLGYEIWLLWQRLSAFRRGEVFVDVDEVAPEDAPPPSRRKRRETPAQARRRKKFWREMFIFGAIWLFCTGLLGWASISEWLAGRSAGNIGLMFMAVLALLPVYVVLSVHLKLEKDRRR